jgi:hypothetical protein
MRKIIMTLILLVQFGHIFSQMKDQQNMPDSLKDWDRKYFANALNNPFIFYVVHGKFTADFRISPGKYRTLGLPEGISLMKYGPAKHPEMVMSFLEGYLWEDLKKSNTGLSGQINNSNECFILSGEIPDTSSLNYLRDVVGVITYLLDNGGISVYDPQAFKFFGKADWTENIFDPNGGVPRNHVMILSSNENGTKWYHTRGLRKFGRPDLSIRNVSPQYEDAVQDLFERFIEYLGFGGIIAEKQEIKMKSLPQGMWCETLGSLDDPDFNNTHTEIHWK